MTRTLTLEGRGTGADVNISLTTQGEDGSVSRFIPKGAKIIQDIVGSVLADGLADGAAVFILKLSDGGISGRQKIVVGAQGAIAVQSGADGDSPNAYFSLEDIDIKVEEDKQIDVEIEMAGSDLGDVDASITLIFD